MAGTPGNDILRFRLRCFTLFLAAASMAIISNDAWAACDAVRSDMIKGTAAIEMAENKDDFLEAAEYFKKAATQCPDAYFNIGIALDKAKHYEEAAKALKTYLSRKPNASDAQAVRDKIAVAEMKADRTFRRMSGTWKITLHNGTRYTPSRNLVARGRSFATIQLDKPSRIDKNYTRRPVSCFKKLSGLISPNFHTILTFPNDSKLGEFDVYVSIKGEKLLLAASYGSGEGENMTSVVGVIEATRQPEKGDFSGWFHEYDAHKYADPGPRCNKTKLRLKQEVTIHR